MSDCPRCRRKISEISMNRRGFFESNTGIRMRRGNETENSNFPTVKFRYQRTRVFILEEWLLILQNVQIGLILDYNCEISNNKGWTENFRNLPLKWWSSELSRSRFSRLGEMEVSLLGQSLAFLSTQWKNSNPTSIPPGWLFRLFPFFPPDFSFSFFVFHFPPAARKSKYSGQAIVSELRRFFLWDLAFGSF